MTAVEWLVEQFETYFQNKVYIEKPALIKILEQAKEMEKQQMKDAVLSQCTTHDGLRKIFDKQFEQYYNETYGAK
jgi:hypothetical protein